MILLRFLAVRSVVFLAAAASLSACSDRENPAPGDRVGVASAPMTPDSSAGMAAMSGMTDMTGDPDHDFLRMMSQHHKGMVAMAHLTKERAEKLAVRSIASRIDTKQDAELDTMLTMLEKDFKDPYTPKIMPEHQAMVDELKGKHGADYDRAFLQNTIKHHGEAVKMIDGYLSKAKNTSLMMMAERMKADQNKEIREYRAKLSDMGA